MKIQLVGLLSDATGKTSTSRWEYCGVQDPAWESGNNIEANKLVEILQEMFQNTNSWPTPEQVCTYHI
jgi:hypothetical protein